MKKISFYLKGFNYPVDPILDIKLSRLLDSGISECSVSHYYIHITFGTGVKGKFWNESKWYAWLFTGSINGYTWKYARPSRKTMWKLIKEIEKYFIEK